MRPVARLLTDATRCSLTWMKLPYGASSAARFWACSVSALVLATAALFVLIPFTVSA
jgi:hypothetical protein